MDCNSLSPPQALTIKSRYCTNLEESGQGGLLSTYTLVKKAAFPSILYWKQIPLISVVLTTKKTRLEFSSKCSVTSRGSLFLLGIVYLSVGRSSILRTTALKILHLEEPCNKTVNYGVFQTAIVRTISMQNILYKSFQLLIILILFALRSS